MSLALLVQVGGIPGPPGAWSMIGNGKVRDEGALAAQYRVPAAKG